MFVPLLWNRQRFGLSDVAYMATERRAFDGIDATEWVIATIDSMFR